MLKPKKRKPLSEETKKKISLAMRGDKNPSKRPEVREKMKQAKLKNPTKYWLGKKRDEMIGNRFSEGRDPWNKGIKRPEICGENNPNWRGGKSKRKLSTPEYKAWRKAVFKRDDHTCQDCGIRGGYLEAHHIKAWSINKELRFELDNGQTLCKECHKKITASVFWGNRYTGKIYG